MTNENQIDEEKKDGREEREGVNVLEKALSFLFFFFFQKKITLFPSQLIVLSFLIQGYEGGVEEAVFASIY